MDWDSGALCRICLDTDRQLISLMENPDNSPINYLGKLQVCVPSLNISESDSYTKHICRKCVPLLDKAFEFHLLCIESDEKLRGPIETLMIKIETKHEDGFDTEVKNFVLEETKIEQPEEQRMVITKKRSKRIKSEPDRESAIKIRKKSKCYDENGKRIRKKPTPKYECDFCGKLMFGRTAIEQHLRIHTGEKPFVCEYCGKAYRSKGHWKLHVEGHDPNLEKKYKCTICTYQTANICYFKRHSIIHTDIRPYTCKLCSKSFNMRSTLYKHTKTVHSTPSLPCHFCELKFNTQRGLRHHIIRHYRAVQYGCPECNLMYAKHKGLVFHMKHKHPGIKWPNAKEAQVKNSTVP